MPRYAHANPASGVDFYKVGPDWIEVRFRGGTRYLYTAASAGMHNIEQMQRLAEAGKGLATFISQHVHDAYARKWD